MLRVIIQAKAGMIDVHGAKTTTGLIEKLMLAVSLFSITANVDSLRGFSEWHKTQLRIKTNESKHTTNNKFINQAENHRKEIVIVSDF